MRLASGACSGTGTNTARCEIYWVVRGWLKTTLRTLGEPCIYHRHTGQVRCQSIQLLLSTVFSSRDGAKDLPVNRTERYTVVHARWLIPQGAACAAALSFFRKGPQLVCTSHGGDLFGLRGSLSAKIKKWVISRAHTITVVSNYMRDHLKKVLAPSCDAKVLPMGVDLIHRFVPDPNVTRLSNELIFVGRLVEKKACSTYSRRLRLFAKDSLKCTCL